MTKDHTLDNKQTTKVISVASVVGWHAWTWREQWGWGVGMGVNNRSQSQSDGIVFKAMEEWNNNSEYEHEQMAETA
jgi:hypothetical protein